MIIAIEKSNDETFEEKKRIEQEEKYKHKCQYCGHLFTRKWGFQVYCSVDCGKKAKLIQTKEYMRRRRLGEIGKDAFKILEDLAQKQQFIEDTNIIQKEKCIACGSTKNVLEHHIRYTPKEEKVILCAKCHMFLHLNLLCRKRCNPKNKKYRPNGTV